MKKGKIVKSAHKDKYYGDEVYSVNLVKLWTRSNVIKVKHLLVLLDCCFAGIPFTTKNVSSCQKDILATLSGNGSRTILTAGTGAERAYALNSRNGKGYGVFTNAFLNAFKSSDANIGSCGLITINEVFSEIYREVRSVGDNEYQQLTPALWQPNKNDFRGTFVFVNGVKTEIVFTEDQIKTGKLTAKKGDTDSKLYGNLVVISQYDGEFYIDSTLVDKIIVGTDIYFKTFPLLVGNHSIKMISDKLTCDTIVNIKYNKDIKLPFILTYNNINLSKQVNATVVSEKKFIETHSSQNDYKVSNKRESIDTSNILYNKIKIAQTLLSAGAIRDAENKCKEVINSKRRYNNSTYSDKYSMAQASHILGEIRHNELNKIKFYDKSDKKFIATKKEKTAKLDAAVKAYSETLKYGIGEWSFLAKFNIGMCYIDFVNDIENKEYFGDPTQIIASKIRVLAGLNEFYENAITNFSWILTESTKQKIKTDLIRKTEIEYSKAIYYNANISEKVGELFSSAPIPRGLSVDERAAYKELLEEKLLEGLEAALPKYKEGLKGIKEKNIENKWVNEIESKVTFIYSKINKN